MRGCTARTVGIVVVAWTVLIVGGAGSLFAETPVKRGPGQVVEVVPDATVPDATGKIRKNIKEVYVDGVLIERTYDQFWPTGEPVGRMRETRFKSGNPDQPLLLEYTDSAGKKYPHVMEYPDMPADTTAVIKAAGGAGAGAGIPAPRTGVSGAGSGSQVVNVPDAKIPDATGKMRTNIKEVYVDGVLVEKSWDQTWPDGTPAGSMKQTGFNNGDPQEIYTDPEGNVMTHPGHSDAPVSVETGAVQSSAASAAAPLSVKASKAPAPKGPHDALHGPKRTGEARAQRAAEAKARQEVTRGSGSFGQFGSRGGFSGDRPGGIGRGAGGPLPSGGRGATPPSPGGGQPQPMQPADPHRMQQQN